MKKEFDARRLDVRKFAQEAAGLQGREPLREYGRLLAETQGLGADEPVTWSAQGEMLNPRHVHPEIWLHLKAQARLALVCQRCLQPVDVDVSVDRSFRFAADESTAATQDEEAEEDVLAESRSFDLHELVEDELLMDMPLAPRHSQCPVTLPASAGDADLQEAEEPRENPFEVLARLKGPRH